MINYLINTMDIINKFSIYYYNLQLFYLLLLKELVKRV